MRLALNCAAGRQQVVDAPAGAVVSGGQRVAGGQQQLHGAGPGTATAWEAKWPRSAQSFAHSTLQLAQIKGLTAQLPNSARRPCQQLGLRLLGARGYAPTASTSTTERPRRTASRRWWRRWRRRRSPADRGDTCPVVAGFCQGRDWGLNGWGQEKTFRWRIGKDSLRSAGLRRLWALLRVGANTRPHCDAPASRQPSATAAVASAEALLKALAGFGSPGNGSAPGSRPGTTHQPASRAGRAGYAPSVLPRDRRGGGTSQAARRPGPAAAHRSAGGRRHRWPLLQRTPRAFAGQLHQGGHAGRCSRGGPGDGAAAGARGVCRSAGPAGVDTQWGVPPAL